MSYSITGKIPLFNKAPRITNSKSEVQIEKIPRLLNGYSIFDENNLTEGSFSE